MNAWFARLLEKTINFLTWLDSTALSKYETQRGRIFQRKRTENVGGNSRWLSSCFPCLSSIGIEFRFLVGIVRLAFRKVSTLDSVGHINQFVQTSKETVCVGFFTLKRNQITTSKSHLGIDFFSSVCLLSVCLIVCLSVTMSVRLCL